MIQWTNQVHPEEEVTSSGAQAQREPVIGSTLHEPDLAWDNLQQQAQWLQQDNCILSSKLHNQEDNERKIRDMEDENTRLKEQSRAILTENHDLKQKLSDFQNAKEIKEKALKKLSVYKEEIEVLKPVLEEKRKLQEMTETLDAEKQKEMLMRHQAEEMNVTLKQRLNYMNDQIQKFHALLDLKDSELKDLKGKNVKLQRKLQILSPIRHPQEDREDHCETENSRFKRKRLPECSRCHTGFPFSLPCSVHEKRPVPLQTIEKDDNGLLYWPCCGKQGRQEPEDMEDENTRLKEQSRAILTENHDLKQKLSDFQNAKEIKEKALKKLSVYKEEIEVLKPVLEEKRKLQEMTETLDAEKQKEMLMRHQAEEMNVTLKQRLNYMNDQIQKFHALLDLKDSELKDLKGKNVKLQRKLQILSPIRHPQEDREDHCETENSRFKRKRLPECSRCHTGFPFSLPCSVHEKRPVPLQTIEKDDNGLLYWPCCGKQGRQEPEGCKKFMNHAFEC